MSTAASATPHGCVCGSTRPYAACCGSGDARNAAVERLFAEAIRRHQHGQIPEAEQAYQRVLAAAPEHPGALYFLGASLLERGKAKDARPYLVKSLALQPERDARAYHALGLSAHMCGELPAAQEAYQQSLTLDPSQTEVRNNLALVLRKLGKLDEAVHIIESVSAPAGSVPSTMQILTKANLLVDQGRTDEAIEYFQKILEERPDDFAVLNNLGALLNQLQRYDEGMALLNQAESQLQIYAADLHYNRGRGLQNLNKLDEAVTEFEKVLAQSPRYFRAYSSWALLEEQRHNLERAAELARQALAIDAHHPENIPATVILSKAFRRQREHDKALEMLRAVDLTAASPGLRANYYFELGTLLDAQHDYDAAFTAFVEANRASLSSRRKQYEPQKHRELAGRLMDFFTPERVRAMGQLSPAPQPNLAQPIFITGFPRSGTTLVEQILSAHPQLHAGDELHYINELVGGIASNMLTTTQRYPECLTEAARPEQHDVFERLRGYYLDRARLQGVLSDDVRRFTDKMPLNEWHLGLIHLMFPGVPIIHVVRHPLDSCLSSFFQELSHGGYCSYDLTTVAQHYAQTFRLTEHYRTQLPLKFLRIRYEDLVGDLENHVRLLLDLVGVPFDERCLAFHESKRVARTASYAQVTQKLYTSSQYRYRRYRKQIEPMIPILEPIIRELGYEIEGAI